MSCARYRQLLSRYVDGEVTPRQRTELLEHVQQCHECAAWLARARQADVLLKGVPETRPSDHVRSVILGSIRGEENAEPPRKHPSRLTGWRLVAAEWLLRLNLSPRKIIAAMAAAFIGLVGLAYWFGIIPQSGSYDKLGFEIPADGHPASVNSTPLAAISSGKFGVGGPVAAPNLVRAQPTEATTSVALDAPISVRFDQPMDRSSVESAMRVDPPVGGSFSWPADNEVHFTPASPGLLRGVTYTVSLSNTARSLPGTPLNKPIAWSFRTRDPYSVSAGIPSGSTVPLNCSLSLTFQVPMDPKATEVSLHAEGRAEDIQATSKWDAAGKALTLVPAKPLPEGRVYLRVGALSKTRTGDTLGQAYEFTYQAAPPPARLRLLDGHLRIAPAQAEALIAYEATSGDLPADPLNVDFKVYSLPGEYLSTLGAQTHNWPEALPAGIVSRLAMVQSFQATASQTTTEEQTAGVPPLAPGTYLLTASASTREGPVSDWQLLVVQDANLVLLENGAFWATGPDGKPWTGSEISLYSPAGALLEKGATNGDGLWLPSERAKGATLALARDARGHLAALDCSAGEGCAALANVSSGPQAASTAITLQTDRETYRPGDVAAFRVLVHTGGGSQGTPAAEQDVAVSLLTPRGALLSALALKLDSVGGASGTFSLSPELPEGDYAVDVRSGTVECDFTLHVVAAPDEGLSLFIEPNSTHAQPDAQVITRTVSVLGPDGVPAAGTALTATLRIGGDTWASTPVTSTTGSDGRATVALPLPAGSGMANDPALYLDVEGTWSGKEGSAHQYLDMGTASAFDEMAAPWLDLVAGSKWLPDGSIRVVLSSLGGSSRAVSSTEVSPTTTGAVLLVASAPSGERLAKVVDLPSSGEIAVSLSSRFGDGEVRFYRAGVTSTRLLALPPTQGPDLTLQITTARTVRAGGDLPVQLSLVNKQASRVAGTATVWLRRASGSTSAMDYEGTLSWKPSVELDPAGPVTSTLTAPPSQGLWYVMGEAATGDGGYARSFEVVRVLPGVAVQLPPRLSVTSGQGQTFAIVVYNPLDTPLSTGMGATLDGPIALDGAGSQAVDVQPGDWQRLEWPISAASSGSGTISFSFVPSAGVGTIWSLPVTVTDNPGTSSTYVSGVLAEERQVGVQVPSGLSSDHVQLEIRASTHLMPALAGIASEISGSPRQGDMGLDAAVTRFAAASLVAAAYRSAGYPPPDWLHLPPGERTLLIEAICGAQHSDGSWSASLDRTVEPGGITHTAYVLVALHRDLLATTSDAGAASKSGNAEEDAARDRALAYLTAELQRPVPPDATASTLDERAFGLYALAVNAALPLDLARSYMAFVPTPLSGTNARLSGRGQAWLALALWQAGAKADALAVAGRIAEGGAGAISAAQPDVLAPMLGLFVVLSSDETKGAGDGQANLAYDNVAAAAARALMESRSGAGWASPADTGEALWALSLYGSRSPEEFRRATPTVTLNDRVVEAPDADAERGIISVALTGDALHPGTNWLDLQPAGADQVLYYSLTLKATK